MTFFYQENSKEKFIYISIDGTKDSVGSLILNTIIYVSGINPFLVAFEQVKQEDNYSLTDFLNKNVFK